jgi:AhpD family alkylhydroperoxidase
MSGPAGAPRVAPGGLRDVGLRTWVLSRGAGVVTGTEPLKLFLTLGRHRRLFHGWLRFARVLMPFGRLPRREAELVILRVGHARACAYEVVQHEALGRRRAGLTLEDLRAVQWPDVESPPWSERERAVLRATDELVSSRDVSDATWAELCRHLSERERIELCMLVAHYDMLATVIGTLRIEPDERRRG